MSAKLFSAEGLIASRWPPFIYRCDQQELAGEVDALFKKGGVLLAEAPTGTGKTFAYLTSVLQAEQPSIISTSSHALQQQLVQRDIPQLAKILGRSCKVVELLGITNYYCPKQGGAASGEGGARQLRRRAEALHHYWLQQGEPVIPWRTLASDAGIESAQLYAHVTVSQGDCTAEKCPWYERCPYFRQRHQLTTADIAVVNHALFYSTMAPLSQSIRGRFTQVVFDEAHRLEQLAIDRSTTIFDRADLERVLAPLQRWVQGEEDGAELGQLIRRCRKLLQLLELRLQRLQPESSGDWPELCLREPRLMAVWQPWRRSFRLLLAYMRLWGLRSGRFLQAEKTLLRYQHSLSPLQPGALLWYQRRQGRLSIHSVYLQQADAITNLPQTSLFISSSLSVDGDFSAFSDTLRLEKYDFYCSQLAPGEDLRARYYLPASLPAPGMQGHIEALMTDVLPLLRHNQGRALLLFSSLDNRKIAEGWLRQYADDFNLCVASRGAISQAVAQFSRRANSLLLATGLWDGLDIPGANLSLVIIDKIPFSSPDDFRVQARSKMLNMQGRDPFVEWQLPQAILRLRQGVGRLIRADNDGGVVVIGDSRLHYQGYRQQIMAALPQYPMTSDRQVALSFIESRPSFNVATVS
ncbi:ATP-dependent DNA helicase [Sinobacterium caligoides]|nr:ATP-dependent DNA helicase [Sinobacterium caligoides]